MNFSVEEENLICMYHNADRRRTIGKITAAMPGMDGDEVAVRLRGQATGMPVVLVAVTAMNSSVEHPSGHQ